MTDCCERVVLVGLWLVVGVGCKQAPPAVVDVTPPSATVNDARPPRPEELPLTKAAVIDLVLGVNGHIVVLKYDSRFPEYRDVREKIVADPGVVAAEPFIIQELRAASSHGSATLVVKGIDPELAASVLTIDDHMLEGSTHALARPSAVPQVILGDVSAKELRLRVGDRLTLVAPFIVGAGSIAPTTPTPFQVSGVFHTGFDQYDRKLALTTVAAMQQVVGGGDSVTGIELKVRDLDHSSEVTSRIARSLGGALYHVMDWRELNQHLLESIP